MPDPGTTNQVSPLPVYRGDKGEEAGHIGAVAGIRMAILRGEMAPGQRLVESELAERFEVSRGNVRSALLVLGNEGLVERVHNRGARVRSVSLHEAIEITEVRCVVEGMVAAKAAERVTEPDVEELREIGAQMRAAVADGDMIGYSELNRRLHRTVRGIARHGVATELIERLRGQSGVSHQFRLALQPGRAKTSMPEHLAIIDAIASGDPDAAEAAMRAHLRSVAAALEKTDPGRGLPLVN